MNVFIGMDKFLGLKIMRLEDELSLIPDVKKWECKEFVKYYDDERGTHRASTAIGKKMAHDYNIKTSLISEIKELRSYWRENHNNTEFDRSSFNYRPRKENKKLEKMFGRFEDFVEDSNPYEDAKTIIDDDKEFDSKTEMVINRVYKAFHIECKFHVPIILPNGEPVNIDVVPYIPEIGTYRFHEHFGMVGQPRYQRRHQNKYAWYMECGLLPGKDILYTYENASMPAEYGCLENSIRAFILSNL